MLRIGLFFVPIIVLVACASGPQGEASKPAPECRPWPSWQDFSGLANLKYRLRYCGYDEDTKEQLWEAQFRNDHHRGVSFSYALGSEPMRYRMDLPPSRTRSSVPLMRATAPAPGQTVWLSVREFCAWGAGQRSCSPL